MSELTIDPENTAVLFTDPQVDALKPEGVMWEQVGDLVEEHDVVEKLETIQNAARKGNVPVFYSPHYYDDDEFESWEELNGIDQKMFDTEMYHVDKEGSNIIPELEPDDNTFVLSSHKHLSGFWANDIQAQLTKRGIDTLVVAGMFANLCVESHMRDAIENGFKVIAVTDATAAPGEDFLEAAKTNAEMIAHETAETDDVVGRLSNAGRTASTEPAEE
ncbi:cysteine hydrolase [Halostagnicola sp. A-GB9-2]|uniref:cysteine hydrolase family protein n=1 Tax=Halostagnicola sp. A-GB9-2 TaxID=3048066 RepID=UPI0024BFF331|nr:cysteine hydrolase [Halostagnicola sp. A-GB9-2]MDJ1434713.1 cysteine hydrolase [Halostagnicola sp. A-GB9-2]